MKIHLVLALLTLAACAEPPADAPPPGSSPGDSTRNATPSVEEASTTSFRFVVPESGVPAWGDVPFPGELYRDDEGRIAIGEFPNSTDDPALVDSIRDLVAGRKGFCTTCNVSFFVDGSLDEASLEGNVHIVEVDAAESELGDRIPVRWEYDAESGRLAVRPRRGHTLHPSRTYAAFVTRSVRGGDGLRLAPSDELEAALAGRVDVPGFQQALGTLEDFGTAADELAALTVFTTDEPMFRRREVYDAVGQAPVPVGTVDRVWTGDEIDTLLGVPADGRPGVDRPPQAGTEGTRAVRHETTGWVVAGTFTAPSFIEDRGAQVGVVDRDPTGAPRVTGTADVPYLLIVPSGVDLETLPVLVVHHGFSASRTTGFALADTAGRAGFGVLAIDAYEHGARAASARDVVHAMRGEVEGADGFAETNKLAVTSRIFGFTGVPRELALSPQYALSAFTQFAADAHSTIRFVREGDIDALRDVPGLSQLSFDTDNIVFLGNSMGAVVGVSVASVERDLRAVVLNVMPGSIVETLAESGEFRPLSERVLLPAIGVEPEFDGADHQMIFDPTVDLFRWAIEPIDPLALAGALGEAPTDLLVQLATHDEVAAPRASQAVVDVAELTHVTYYSEAMHGMLEVNEQESRFEEPLVPPLQPRAEPVVLPNPTEEVHREIEGLLADVATGDR